MDEERPYMANYGIGLIVVMGFHMLFYGSAALAYPDLFGNEYADSQGFQMFFIGTGCWELFIAVTLFLKSGISYKFAILSLVLIVTLTLGNMLLNGHLGFTIWVQTILGGASLALLLTRDVRRFYNNWSFGDLPQMDLDT